MTTVKSHFSKPTSKKLDAGSLAKKHMSKGLADKRIAEASCRQQVLGKQC